MSLSQQACLVRWYKQEYMARLSPVLLLLYAPQVLLNPHSFRPPSYSLAVHLVKRVGSYQAWTVNTSSLYFRQVFQFTEKALFILSAATKHAHKMALGIH